MSKKHIKAAQRLLGVEADGYFGQGTLDALTEKLGVDPIDPDDMILSDNFRLKEILHSDTATAMGISNRPTSSHLNNIEKATTYLFQPVRELLDHPMYVTSGYRSTTLNRAVGGSKTSAHSYGFAIDFRCPGFGSTIEVAEFLVKKLKERNIKYD